MSERPGSTGQAGNRDWRAEARAARRALAVDPSDVDARLQLFWSLLRLGRVDDARLEGRRLIAEGIASLPVLVAISRILIQTGSAGEAVELLRPRWREDPAAGAILAWAYEATEKTALAEFVRAEIRGARYPSNVGGGRVYFANQLVRLLRTHREDAGPATSALVEVLDEGRFAEAGPIFLRWISSSPNPSLALLARADWAMLAGNLDEAEFLLRGYSVDHSLGGEVENRLGDIARLKGQLSEAKRHWKRAAVLNPRDWNAWMDLIHAETVSGNHEAAGALCERVLRSDPPVHVRRAVRAVRSSETPSGSRSPGVFGLAWTENGGGLLSIQCELDPDRQGLLLTGHTGRVLEESARVAFEYLRRVEGAFDDGGVHLHFPDMRMMVDGASAGLALLTTMWVKAVGRTLERRVALTGQIGLAGELYPIDGLKEKLISAHLNEIDLCVIPSENRADLAWLPASVRRDLQILPVSSFDDVKDIL